MKRLFSLVLALMLLLFCAPLSVFAEKETEGAPAQTQTAEEAPPAIYDLPLDSQGVYFLNTDTETVLYAKAENSRMFPASLTKMMTAYVVLQECENPQTETVTIQNVSAFDYIIKDGGVHMELKIGETFTVYDLLVGLMISSFCDVGDLLAERFGDGEISKFIDKMNDTAAKLGMENSHFENPHGLHHPNHYSSPRDMAILLREAMTDKTFREIVSLRSYTVPATSKSEERNLRYTVQCYQSQSKNYLSCYVGGKSGFTTQAGRCLATYSEQDGATYISVLFGANLENKKYKGNMAEQDTYTLLSHTHEYFSLETVFEQGQEIAKLPITDSSKTVSVVAKENVVALVDRTAEPTYDLDLPDQIHVDELKDGKRIGTLYFSFNSRTSDKPHPLVLLWDEKPVVTKTALEKGAEGAAHAISDIFTEDRIFVILFICLILVICITLPLLHLSNHLHRRKFHKPKH